MRPPGCGARILWQCRRLRRQVPTSAALCVLLVAGQIAMPLAAASHLQAHVQSHRGHAHVHADAPREAAPRHDGPVADAVHERSSPILRSAPPEGEHLHCPLCHLIAGSQPTLLVSPEVTAHADVPATGRLSAALAQRPVEHVLTGAMPRAPPVAASLL